LYWRDICLNQSILNNLSISHKWQTGDLPAVSRQGDFMKMIVAIIQPYKLEEVLEELYKVDVNLVTVSEVMGHGRQKGVTEVYRGVKEMGNLLRKIRLDIAVNEDFAEPTINAILKGAKTGQVGDGKVFVMDLDQCIRIRTGERDSVAIG
jgi:nitrogen regulatory protein P-II 1